MPDVGRLADEPDPTASTPLPAPSDTPNPVLPATPPPSAGASGPTSARVGIGILVLITSLCVGIEAALLLSDWGWIGHGRLRRMAYAYGGFWPGLLRGWQPNFLAQPVSMFATYGFLHGGVLHLGFNMATLWSLGRPLIETGGPRRFVILWAASQIMGGVGYAALSSQPQPMVGASGALFGLAGGWLASAWNAAVNDRQTHFGVIRVMVALVGLNVLMMIFTQGQLAWQAHLGGFIGGWVAALVTRLPQPASLSAAR